MLISEESSRALGIIIEFLDDAFDARKRELASAEQAALAMVTIVSRFIHAHRHDRAIGDALRTKKASYFMMAHVPSATGYWPAQASGTSAAMGSD